MFRDLLRSKRSSRGATSAPPHARDIAQSARNSEALLASRQLSPAINEALHVLREGCDYTKMVEHPNIGLLGRLSGVRVDVPSCRVVITLFPDRRSPRAADMITAIRSALGEAYTPLGYEVTEGEAKDVILIIVPGLPAA